jgi:hypothetical protein
LRYNSGIHDHKRATGVCIAWSAAINFDLKHAHIIGVARAAAKHKPLLAQYAAIIAMHLDEDMIDVSIDIDTDGFRYRDR